MEVERPQKTGQPPRIPIETWEAIFRYLTDASDLRNVSLTSRYMNEVVQPILYKRLYLDPNDYAIYTLLLLQGKLELRQKVIDLTLLPPTERPDGKYDCVDVEGLYGTLGLPHADWPPEFTSVRESLTWSPLGSPAISQRGGMGFEMYSRPIFHFLPRFPNLSTLRIIHDCIPEDFLTWISRLPQLRKLVLRDSALSSDLRALPERVELPLQELTMIRVYNKTFGEPHVTNHLCDTLIGGSPHLRSLVMDSFVERVVCNLLSEIEHPPPVEVFVSTGAGQQDLDTVTLRNVLNGLPTITTLTMARIPRELAPLLPRTALPNLRSVKGQIKSLGMFFRAERPIEDISVTDTPTSSGGVSWDTTIIQFFELLSASGTPLRSLTFCMGQWSEEVFLCVCQLFPKLKVLKIQCNSGTVDGYFRISFGPRFLPTFKELEILHIFERTSKPRFSTVNFPKGIRKETRFNLVLSEDDMIELIEEAPVHYRRWVRDHCPSLREVAFNREVWWKRLDYPSLEWTMVRDVIPTLIQTSPPPTN